MNNKINIDNRKFVVRMTCSECGFQLNETKDMDYKEMQKEWTMIVMGSGFNAGRCPECSSSTFSDLNIHTELKIFDKELDREVEFALFKKLSGRFYSDEYNDICKCKEKTPTYISEKYPIEVHTCGKFIKKYKN